MDLEIIGRQSSHYTRVTRIFAHELCLPVALRPIFDLLSLHSNDYGANPALKLPILRINGESVFGTLNICRLLARQAGAEAEVVWPEQADTALLLNAHELVAHAMAAQVDVVLHEIVEQRAPDAASRKRRQSLIASLQWLEAQLPAILIALPRRRLSYLEVSLFCLLTHLPFRNPLDLGPTPALQDFTRSFGERPSAQATPYQFDQAPAA